MKCTCGREVKDHPAEPCLDAVFAEKVMGWKVLQATPEAWLIEITPNWSELEKYKWKAFNFFACPEFSSNIAHAMEGVEKHKEHLRVNLCWDGTMWGIQVWEKVDSTDWIGMADEQLGLGITRALILWAGKEE